MHCAKSTNTYQQIFSSNILQMTPFFLLFLHYMFRLIYFTHYVSSFFPYIVLHRWNYHSNPACTYQNFFFPFIHTKFLFFFQIFFTVMHIPPRSVKTSANTITKITKILCTLLYNNVYVYYFPPVVTYYVSSLSFYTLSNFFPLQSSNF
jgi:hypothetical protein